MKEIKLLNLKLENFKGIREFKLNAEGQNINVLGDNGAGKTTLFDAFTWLLFDKDSKGQSQFDIKTLDEDGNVKEHGINHAVEGKLLIDDNELQLRKEYKEKWVKKRGSAEKKFSGHTTNYYIDDVPVKKKEYDQRISEIIDEDIFRLLTDPRYFNEQLHWEDRREILLEVCGDVTDEDVIQENEKLSKLEDVLGKRDIEEHKKVIKSKQKKINDKLEEIPTRIDEANNNLPDVSGLDWKEIQSEIGELEGKKEQKETQLSQLKNGGEKVELKKQISEIETELNDIKNNYKQKFDDEIEGRKNDLNLIKDNISEIERAIKDEKSKIEHCEKVIEKKEQKMEDLRQEWHEVDGKFFDENKFQFVVCPECDHEFAPAVDLEEERKKFNIEKANDLEDINQQGQEEKEKVEKLKSEIEEIQEKISDYKDKLENLKEERESIQSEIEDLQKKTEHYKDSGKYQEKLQKKEKLQEQIENVDSKSSFSFKTKQKEIDKLDEKIGELKDQISDIKQHNKGKKRIKELKEQEKKLSKEYEKLEEQLYLTEEFTRTKVNLLEEKINSHFEYTEFKLFEEQVNGGLKETCQALYNGVSYNSTLNTGAKFKVGIDIIETLAEHYDFRAPIFIDGRESITQLPDTESQLISLIVSPEDPELRIEKESQNIKEAI